MKTSDMTRISNFAFPLICQTKTLRDKYIKLAEKAKIEIRPIVAGNINNQVFFKKYISKKFLLKNADRIQNTGFYFGNNPEMTKEEIKKIIKTFS